MNPAVRFREMADDLLHSLFALQRPAYILKVVFRRSEERVLVMGGGQ